MTDALILEGVSAGYPSRPRALDEVSFAVHPGEAVAVIGASGAGKSTLFRALSRLSRPQSGRIMLGADDLYAPSSRRSLRGRIGLVHQQHAVPGPLPVAAAVLAGSMHAWPLARVLRTWVFGPSPHDRARAAEKLEQLGLPGRDGDLVSQLSIGQRQRVAVARSLIQSPDLLLADEPIAAVDPATADAVLRAMVAHASTGAMVLCSVHDVARAVEHFPRIIALREGAVAYDGPSDGLTEDHVRALYGGTE